MDQEEQSQDQKQDKEDAKVSEDKPAEEQAPEQAQDKEEVKIETNETSPEEKPTPDSSAEPTAVEKDKSDTEKEDKPASEGSSSSSSDEDEKPNKEEEQKQLTESETIEDAKKPEEIKAPEEKAKTEDPVATPNQVEEEQKKLTASETSEDNKKEEEKKDPVEEIKEDSAPVEEPSVSVDKSNMFEGSSSYTSSDESSLFPKSVDINSSVKEPSVIEETKKTPIQPLPPAYEQLAAGAMEAVGQLEDDPKEEKSDNSSNSDEDSKFFPRIPEPTEEPAYRNTIQEPEIKPVVDPPEARPVSMPQLPPQPAYQDVDESVICFDTSMTRVAGGKIDAPLEEDSVAEIKPPTLAPNDQPPLPITMICDNDLDVEIEVENPYVQVTGIRKHVRYTVKGRDENDSFAVERRFKEFLALRKRLSERWPGFFIPSLPPKKATGNMDSNFVNKRQKLLNSFAKKCANISHLYYTEEFQQFLRGDANFHNIKRDRITVEQVYEKFSTHFSKYTRMTITEEILDSLQEDYQYFKNILVMLTDNERIVLNANHSYSMFAEQFDRLNKTMIDIEQAVEPAYSIKQVFHSTESTNNPFVHILDWIRAEQLDIQSLLETFEKKDELGALKARLEKQATSLTLDSEKLSSGKKTMGTLFSSKAKVEGKRKALEENVKQIQTEIDYINYIMHVIILRLHEHELPRFKKLKGETYHSIISNFAQQAVENFSKNIKFCEKLVAADY